VRIVLKQVRMKMKVELKCNFQRVTGNSIVNLMEILQGSHIL